MSRLSIYSSRRPSAAHFIPRGCSHSYMKIKLSMPFKRLLLRFERIQLRHYGMKVMAYTLINLRAFCGI